MIFLNNHNDKDIRDEINAMVGHPYSFMERLKMGGNGCSRLYVEEYSPKFSKHFGESQDRKTINIELRENGILVYINNKVNNYVWVIPYYRLNIYQTKTFSIYADGAFIKVKKDSVFPMNKKFVDKLMQLRLNFLEPVNAT